MRHSNIEIKILATGSSGNAIIISDGGPSPLLLDAGLSYRQLLKLSNFNIPQHCLITHEHQDHSKGIKDLLKYGVDCYMSNGTVEALGLSKRHNLHVVEELKEFEIENWRVKPFLARHDAAEPFGYLLKNRMEKILFAMDTAYIPYRFTGLTYVLVECNWSQDIIMQNFYDINVAVLKRVIRTHMSLERVVEFLKQMDLEMVKGIYLLHSSEKNSDLKLFKKVIEETTGRVVYINE